MNDIIKNIEVTQLKESIPEFAVGDTVKVGLVAQSPQGEGGIRVFEDLSIEHKTVRNIRAGK